MAFQVPAAPQAFAFGLIPLMGRLVSFTGKSTRRHVVHEFLKRDGAVVEDMGEGPQHLEARLQFLGASAAVDYENFKAAIHDNPSGLLVHPIAGKFYAFCEGPNESVDFARALNQIEVTCSWIESQLDSTLPTDTPDVATAAQNCSGQLNAFQQSVATCMAALAKAQTLELSALNALDAAEAQVSSLTSPIDAMKSIVDQALGAASSIAGSITSIQVASDILYQDVTNYIAGANAMFTGDSDVPPAGYSNSIASLLGAALVAAQVLEDALIAAGGSPASAAAAVQDVELLADMCLTLNDAVVASQPPVISYTVQSQVNLVVLAQLLIQQWGLSRDALEYASAILGLNRVPNPAAIPAGTVLQVPAQ